MDTSVNLLLVITAVFYLTLATPQCQKTNSHREFAIDYENDRFLKDGQPFRYVSGSLHYFRVPRVYWRDRLRKYRAMGLNAVCTYIEWKFHEISPGQFDFSGDKDVEHFIKLAQDEGLLVILRPGPYICAERDLGGFPIWLLHKKPNIYLRTSDPTYKKYTRRWYKQLFPRLQPLLYGNGGPVIMLQVENEYGSYEVCDHAYTIWLRDLYRSYVGDKAVLFTTDGNARYYLNCTIPGVFITVDFGPQKNVTAAFDPMRELQKRGPLVNSEFYTGRLMRWGKPPSFFPGYGPKTENVVNSTRQLLELGASFNFYMLHGGTSFDFTSGANYPYRPQITSYDNNSPISESGNLTYKYYAIKEVISEFLPIPNIEINDPGPMDYGTVVLEPKVSLFASNTSIDYGVFKHPRTFERLKLYSGFLLYETKLPQSFQGQGILSVETIHDRTMVFIDKKIQGIMSRTYNVSSLEIAGTGGQTLSLLVENQGHINYMSLADLKGILSDVTLDGVVLKHWHHTGYPMVDVCNITSLTSVSAIDLPGYFSGEFELPGLQDPPQDTFFDMTGWTKGVVYINGMNLGRYWPVQGPQVTIYCPGPFLKPQNVIVVMELESPHPNRTISLIDYTIFQNVSKPPLISEGDDIFVENI